MSQAMADVEVPDQIRRLVNNVLDAKHTDASNLLEQVRVQLLEVATTLADASDPQVASLRQEYAELLTLQKEVELHKVAMREDMIVGYKPSLKHTDFAKVLDASLNQRKRVARYDPHSTDQMKKFLEDAGLQGDADDDEDIVVESEGIHGLKCPLTMKMVMELPNPVEDDHGYIYDRDAILKHIRNAGGTVRCPTAGTSHVVKEHMLKPSKRVLREKRRLLMQASTQAGGTAPGTAPDDVFDADDL